MIGGVASYVIESALAAPDIATDVTTASKMRRMEFIRVVLSKVRRTIES